MTNSSNKTVIKYIAVLNIPQNIDSCLMYAKTINKDMTNNPYFPGSASKLGILVTRIGVLDLAQTGFCSIPQTVTFEQRNDALENVKETLHSLKNDVQEVANVSGNNAPTVIISSGMSVKKNKGHGKLNDSVRDGAIEGSVILRATGKGPHEWRMSSDEINWTNLKPTRRATTKVSNLIPGTMYY